MRVFLCLAAVLGSERQCGTAWAPQYCSCLGMAESRGPGKPGKAALHWLVQSCLQPLRLGTWAYVSGKKKSDLNAKQYVPLTPEIVMSFS